MSSIPPIRQQLEALLQGEISPEQFYGQYLKLLSAALPAARGFHLWVLQGAQLVPIGGSDLTQTKFEADSAQKDFILEMLHECRKKQKTFSVDASKDRNQCPYVLVFTPLLYGDGQGAVQGAQLSWWEVPPGQSLNPGLFALLDDCGRSAAKMARTQKLESMSQIAGQLQLMTTFLNEAAAAPDATGLALAIANRTRELTGCDRCALLVIKPDDHLELRAISNVPFPDPRSAVARTLVQLAENGRSIGLPTAYRKASEKTEEKGDLSDYFYHSRMAEVVLMGIQSPQGELLGVLIVESMSVGFFKVESQQVCANIASHAAGPLRRVLEYENLPALPFLKSVGRWRALPPAERRRNLKKFLWIPLVVLLAILLFPVAYEFSGDARLMPSRRAVAIAEAPGRVLEILVQDGDTVVASQPLARLDDSEQRKQLEIAMQEEARLQAETDRLQSVTQADRAAARISQLNLERVRKEKEFHAAQVARATILSPIDGILMAPGLASRQGEAMVFGSQLALIGDPSAWELEVHVSEADVTQILTALAKGRKIPVRFSLNSFPGKKFSSVLDDASAVSATSEVINAKNVFRIRIALQDKPAGETIFRAGFTGRAKLKLGYRPLSYTMTRRFFNWIRTNVLF